MVIFVRRSDERDSPIADENYPNSHKCSRSFETTRPNPTPLAGGCCACDCATGKKSALSCRYSHPTLSSLYKERTLTVKSSRVCVSCRGRWSSQHASRTSLVFSCGCAPVDCTAVERAHAARWYCLRIGARASVRVVPAHPAVAGVLQVYTRRRS